MDKAHIFVANDNMTFLELMQAVLEDENYRVTVLHVADKAYEEIKQAKPNLVILDIMLEHPDDGWQVLENLKLDTETTKIPVIICSGDLRSIRGREDYLLKMKCFTLNKPFDLDVLLAMVLTALARS